MSRAFAFRCLCSFAVLTLVTCAPPKAGPTGSGEQKVATVGASGGEVEVEGTTLTIPPGAVPEGTTITVTSTTEPAPAEHEPLSPLFKFEPEGLQFAVPVKVSMPVPATNAERAVIYWSKASGPGYDALPTGREGDVLVAEVTHFSSGFVGTAEDSSEPVTTTCSIPAMTCSEPCTVTCSGDLPRAYCRGGLADSTAGCSSSSSCTCIEAPRSCEVAADTACGLPGCSVFCSDPSTMASCSVATSSGPANGGTGGPDGGAGEASCPAAPPRCVCVDFVAPSSSDPTSADAGTPPAPVADGGSASGGCIADGECGAGRRCVGGLCQFVDQGGFDGGSGPPPCGSSVDCGPGMVCEAGVCRPDGAVPNPDGGPNPPTCASSIDCAVGQVCDAGRCIPAGASGGDGGSAPPQCTLNAECGPGMQCEAGRCRPVDPVFDGGSTPPTGCASDVECGPMMSCIAGRCEPGGTSGADGGSPPPPPTCTSNVDCGAGMTCIGGQCRPEPPPPTDGGSSPPGCTDNAQCPPSTVCLAGACSPVPCQSDTQCPAAYRCDPVLQRCLRQ